MAGLQQRLLWTGGRLVARPTNPGCYWQSDTAALGNFVPLIASSPVPAGYRLGPGSPKPSQDWASGVLETS